jgi:hypothetical protein
MVRKWRIGVRVFVVPNASKIPNPGKNSKSQNPGIPKNPRETAVARKKQAPQPGAGFEAGLVPGEATVRQPAGRQGRVTSVAKNKTPKAKRIPAGATQSAVISPASFLLLPDVTHFRRAAGFQTCLKAHAWPRTRNQA